MDYLAIKHLHVACALASGSFFLLRGVWMLQGSAWLTARWVSVAPHLIDTLLLVSALTLALRSGQYPFAQPWLTAKLLALCVYIALGTIALKRGRSKTVRTVALVAALVTFAYIVTVAVTRRPFPFDFGV
ncbi:MAG: SirB2 family protein [Pseudomonadota bacterium]|nr:SirB2 family protein [Pseudomonadota bacterium]